MASQGEGEPRRREERGEGRDNSPTRGREINRGAVDEQEVINRGVLQTLEGRNHVVASNHYASIFSGPSHLHKERTVARSLRSIDQADSKASILLSKLNRKTAIVTQAVPKTNSDETMWIMYVLSGENDIGKEELICCGERLVTSDDKLEMVGGFLSLFFLYFEGIVSERAITEAAGRDGITVQPMVPTANDHGVWSEDDALVHLLLGLVSMGKNAQGADEGNLSSYLEKRMIATKGVMATPDAEAPEQSFIVEVSSAFEEARNLRSLVFKTVLKASGSPGTNQKIKKGLMMVLSYWRGSFMTPLMAVVEELLSSVPAVLTIPSVKKEGDAILLYLNRLSRDPTIHWSYGKLAYPPSEVDHLANRDFPVLGRVALILASEKQQTMGKVAYAPVSEAQSQMINKIVFLVKELRVHKDNTMLAALTHSEHAPPNILDAAVRHPLFFRNDTVDGIEGAEARINIHERDVPLEDLVENYA